MKKMKDNKGNILHIGDRVRILAIPDLTGMTAAALAETLPVFKHALGTYRRISAFSRDGLIEIKLRIIEPTGWQSHFIFIEPNLVSKPRK